MPVRRTPRLNLDRLDDRIVPAIGVNLTPAGVLNVIGAPTGVLQVQQTAPNTLNVTDGATNYGTFKAPAGLNITIQSFKQAVLVDVGSFTYGSNVTIDLGFGSTFKGIKEVSIFDADGAAGGLGKIAGNVTVRNGNGGEFISIGRPSSTAGIDIPVQVNGNVFVSTKYNAGPDAFELVPGSVVQTGLYLTNIDNTSLGVFTPGSPVLSAVGGNVVISNAQPQGSFTVDTFANIGGSLTVVSSAGSTKLSSLALNDGTTIGGGLTAVLTNGNDFVFLGTAVPGFAAPQIFGSVNLVLGTNDDSVIFMQDPADFDGPFIGGNASINLGHGNNTVNFEPLAFVAGSMNIGGGSGNNTLTSLATGNFDGTINGNLSVNLGNGDNTINFGGSVFGSQAMFRTGGGDDSVTIAATAQAPTAKLLVFLNGGDDILNVDSVFFASAYLDAGTGLNDDFNSSVIIPINWTLNNFEF